MSTVVALLDQLLNGLTIGIVYVLLAAGLSIVFGVMDVINFAHGELYALGAYFALAVMAAVGGATGFWIALILAPVIVALLGGAIERLTIRPLYGRNPLYHILLTFGLVLILKDVIEFVANANPGETVGFLGFFDPWAGSAAYPVTPEILQGQLQVLGYGYSRYNLFVIGVGSLVALFTWVALNYSRIGLIVRAGAQDRAMVRNLGIDIDRYYTLVFAFGAALAAVAGVVLAGRNGLEFAMGDSVIIPAFVIVVIGGLGSFRGAVVGGLGVGVLQTVMRSDVVAGPVSDTYRWIPVVGEYVPEVNALEGVLVFLLMIVVLLVRPQGLFGNPEWQSSGEEGDLLTSAGEGVLGGKWRFRLGALLVLGLFLAPLGVGARYDSYWVYSLLVTMMVWALFALSLDFVMGYAGLVSLGHVLFFGIGGYATILVGDGRVTDLVAAVPAVGSALADGLAAIGYSESVFFAIGTGILAAAGAAWVVGYLSIRVSGVYFAMITLGFAELFHQAILKLPTSWAGSSDGIYGVDLAYSLFGVNLAAPFGGGDVGDVVLTDQIAIGPLLLVDGEVRLIYFFVLALVVGSYLLARQFMRAPFGSVLQAIREGEQRASFLGYDTTAYKRRAFVVSGALAALAGGLNVVSGFSIGVGPDTLEWINSGEVIVMTILGGMGTLFGPMIGAGVFEGGEELLSGYTEQWQAVLGLFFVVFVIYAPEGLVSLPAKIADRFDLGGGGGPSPVEPTDTTEVDD
jgi:branched-chain amino acid transport system permease protein